MKTEIIINSKVRHFYYEDYSKFKDKALSYEIKKNQDTIMGIPCDLIIVKTKKVKYHFIIALITR